MQATTHLPPILDRIVSALQEGDKRSTELVRIVYGSKSQRLNDLNRLNLRKSIDRLRQRGFSIQCRRNGKGTGTYSLLTDCEHGEPNDGYCPDCLRIRREEEQHSRFKEERVNGGY